MDGGVAGRSAKGGGRREQPVLTVPLRGGRFGEGCRDFLTFLKKPVWSPGSQVPILIPGVAQWQARIVVLLWLV